MGRSLFIVSLFLILLASTANAAGESLGLRLPAGFIATEFADSSLANDIYQMALDPRGRIVVSGRGFIRILVDDDGNGRADRAIDFADSPKDGATGMLWEGDTLWVTGDGGLRAYRDADSDGRADGPSQLVRAFKTGGEHDAHALRRGPDGWLYVLCGNFAGIDKTFATLPTSPIRNPVAGCVVRFSPDLKHSEIVADGFRNPYGMDFGPDGELFAYDSDNERCVTLPWYEFTRFYHIVPGGHYGWKAPQLGQFWRSPPYFFDTVAPVVTLGRGSPTGVAHYHHHQFPEHYRGGMFALDWTFGRVYFVKLRRSGASFTATKEVFLEAVGDNGFAPTAVVVHPATGDLYLSIGGRGTRGAVYRVRYDKPGAPIAKQDAPGLAPPSLDWIPGMAEALQRSAIAGDPLERLRALTSIRRHRAKFADQAIRAILQANVGHSDRYVRQACARLIADGFTPPQGNTGRELLTIALGTYAADPKAALDLANRLIGAKGNDASIRLDAVRLFQLALGDLMDPKAKGTVWEGYSPRRPISASVSPLALRAAFPTGDTDLDREISRTLAVMEDDDPAVALRIADRLTSDSDPVEDIHYLIVLARLRGARTAAVTTRTATALVGLDAKISSQRLNRDRNWPLRLAEVHAELARKDPALNATLLAAREFGRPDHVLFARCPGFDRKKAAETFLARADRNADFAWNPELIELLGVLPADRTLPLLRRLWERGGLESAILPLLARTPEASDRDKLLEGLGLPQLSTVRLCLDGLEKMPAERANVLAVIRAMKRLPEGREGDALRQRMGSFLQRLTGQAFGGDPRKWADWLASTDPALAARLGGADGVDVAGWNQRLARIDWERGRAEPGREVFVKASCASCHSGSQAMGPDLQGVAGRFSRADLFTSILQPSKDISSRYRTLLVETSSGKFHQGLVVYEAVDSLLLQTGPAATMRIVNDQVVSRRLTDTSLMPAGLLDKRSDADIADLYAYLKSLDGGKRR